MGENITLESDAASRGYVSLVPWFSPSHRLLSPSGLRWLVVGLEAVAVVGAAVLTRPVVLQVASYPSVAQAVLLGIGAVLLAALIRRATRRPMDELIHPAGQSPKLAAMALLASMALCGLFWWEAVAESQLEPHAPPAALVLGWMLLWACSSALASFALRACAVLLVGRLGPRRRALVVGEGRACHRFLDAARRMRDFPWRLSGAFDTASQDGLASLRERVSGDSMDIVVLVPEVGPGTPTVSAVCEALDDQPVSLCLAMEWSDLARMPDGTLRCGSYVIQGLLRSPLEGLGGPPKRLLDVGLSALALVVLSPVMLAAAVAIALESPGPVLFRQLRFGMGGQPISVLKFRTMRSDLCDASGEARTVQRDARVTQVGRVLRRSSIDELPQLINVLRGEMSLVGPRPHPLGMVVEGRLYGDVVAHYRARHLVRPGITGWAQVNGSRGAVDDVAKARRRVELDLYYLDNWSLGLDLVILARTATGAFLTLSSD